MQIRCAACGRVVTLVATGVLPEQCPHCMARPVPEKIGGHVIERLLATGGMGEVYLARDEERGVDVAVKLLPPPITENVEVLRERFAREARLQSSVDHPGVVPVLECDVLGDRPYLVLEYVRGRSLRERLADGPLPIGEAVRIAADVADVIAAAHVQGVLHRDIKPENVLIGDDGRVRVLDFGIARASDGEAPLTRTGEIVGTPQYMAPEQLLDAGEEVDERCDVHALGVLTYELLTGKAPFQAANVFAVLKLVESLVPKPPSTLRREVPVAIDAAVQKAMAKDREARWQTAAAFAAALRVAAVSGPSAEIVAGRRAWRRRLAAVVGVVAGVLVVTWGGSLWPGGDRSPGDGSIAFEQPDAAERLAARRASGRQRLQRGEYHAALFDLDGGDGQTREQARMAWLCGLLLLPLCADASRYWARCDEYRRVRLFGAAAGSEPDEAETDAAVLLARGEAIAAWRMLQPVLARHSSERPSHAVTLALLAAHLACRDRRVLRAVTDRLAPEAADDVVELLRLRLLPEGDLAARRDALRARAARFPADGPDRWLCLLLAAGLDDAMPFAESRELAEKAWLNGAGEAATVWFVGARLRTARRTQVPLAVDEVARHRKLLAGAATTDAPAVLMQELLLEIQHGNRNAVLQRGCELPDPVPPSLSFLDSWMRAARRRGDGAALEVARVLVGADVAGSAYVTALADILGGRSRVAPAFVFEPASVGEAVAAAASNADPAASDFLFVLGLLAAAGAEPVPGQRPWSWLAAEPQRRLWLEEVCGGVQ